MLRFEACCRYSWLIFTDPLIEAFDVSDDVPRLIGLSECLRVLSLVSAVLARCQTVIEVHKGIKVDGGVAKRHH